MADIGQLEVALRNADAAGDVAAARALAGEITKMRSASAPSMLSDVGKSLDAGVARGVAGIGGLVGDLTNVGAAGIEKATNFVTDKLGLERAQTGDRSKSVLNAIPTSESMRKAIQNDFYGGEKPYEPQTTAGKYARTGGEFAMGAMGGPGGIVRRAATQVALPAVASEAAGQVTEGTKYEPYARIAGALAAPAVLAGASRIVTPFPASPERQRMVQALAGEGVDLTAGQATGSRALRFAESHLSEIPGGGGRAGDMIERQKEQFTQAALRRVGENAERATPEVIDRAFTRIGQNFDNLSANNAMRADPQFGQDMVGTIQNYFSLVNPTARAPVVQATAQDIIHAVQQNGGVLTGEVYQALRSRLDRMARGARADPQLSDALFGIRNSLDDAMERSMIAAGRQQDVAAWQNARREYRNLLVLERTATGAGEDAALGLVSPAQLRGASVNQNRRDYARGGGDFAELARAGNATMLPMPNSGTPGRVASQALPAMVGAGIGGLVGGAPGAGVGAMAATAGANMLPPLMGRAIMSQPGQAYLGNQALPRMNPGTAQERIAAALLRAQAARPQIEARP